jgi:hypothetical protein
MVKQEFGFFDMGDFRMGGCWSWGLLVGVSKMVLE